MEKTKFMPEDHPYYLVIHDAVNTLLAATSIVEESGFQRPDGVSLTMTDISNHTSFFLNFDVIKIVSQPSEKHIRVGTFILKDPKSGKTEQHPAICFSNDFLDTYNSQTFRERLLQDEIYGRELVRKLYGLIEDRIVWE